MSSQNVLNNKFTNGAPYTSASKLSRRPHPVIDIVVDMMINASGHVASTNALVRGGQ